MRRLDHSTQTHLVVQRIRVGNVKCCEILVLRAERLLSDSNGALMDSRSLLQSPLQLTGEVARPLDANAP